ncbi:MAG TPA: preQ(1) synthase [Acidimicrobiales bacterium]|nr:preQ(1) synthase [Acidimicrobiales bacterium]
MDASGVKASGTEASSGVRASGGIKASVSIKAPGGSRASGGIKASGAKASGIKALGRPSQYRYDQPDPDVLETFYNPEPGSPWAVSLLCSEFTSLCPVTGQPDYGRLRIEYVPDQLCVESKSLKLYLVAYRNHGTFHEACVNQVADDLCGKLSPRYLRVYGDFHPRGGIAIRPLAVRPAPGLSQEEEARCVALLGQVASFAGLSD